MSEEINKPEEMNTPAASEKPRWYVVHTYSGYENKVKANIEKTVENRGMQHLIHEVSVPLQDVVEMKDGQQKKVSRKVFPGYVLLKMIMTDETWYIVRNTRGVTSFVGLAPNLYHCLMQKCMQWVLVEKLKIWILQWVMQSVLPVVLLQVPLVKFKKSA